jgi:hypothetical protein
MRHLDPAARRNTLCVGKLNISFSYLRNDRALDDPLWERLLTAFFFFLMGIVQVYAGLTGVYYDQAIVWIGGWMIITTGKIERWLGVKTDPDLSRRIVDPRHKAAALEAIDKSMRLAKGLRS